VNAPEEMVWVNCGFSVSMASCEGRRFEELDILMVVGVVVMVFASSLQLYVRSKT